LKPERWGSPLVQEKYREEKACDKTSISYNKYRDTMNVEREMLSNSWSHLNGSENLKEKF